MAQVVDQRVADIGREREALVAITLAADHDHTRAPVDVPELERGDFARPQPQARQHGQDREIAPARPPSPDRSSPTARRTCSAAKRPRQRARRASWRPTAPPRSDRSPSPPPGTRTATAPAARSPTLLDRATLRRRHSRQHELRDLTGRQALKTAAIGIRRGRTETAAPIRSVAHRPCSCPPPAHARAPGTRRTHPPAARPDRSARRRRPVARHTHAAQVAQQLPLRRRRAPPLPTLRGTRRPPRTPPPATASAPAAPRPAQPSKQLSSAINRSRAASAVQRVTLLQQLDQKAARQRLASGPLTRAADGLPIIASFTGPKVPAKGKATGSPWLMPSPSPAGTGAEQQERA